VLSCILFFLLYIFWRRFWVSNVEFNRPDFSATPTNPVALASRLIINNPETVDRLLVMNLLHGLFPENKKDQ